jgi:hypothetical protein
MRFVEGGYVFALSSTPYICVYPDSEKGKTKEKGNHYKTRATPGLSSKVTKEKKKSASEEDTYEPPCLFIHDG